MMSHRPIAAELDERARVGERPDLALVRDVEIAQGFVDRQRLLRLTIDDMNDEAQRPPGLRRRVGPGEEKKVVDVVPRGGTERVPPRGKEPNLGDAALDERLLSWRISQVAHLVR